MSEKASVPERIKRDELFFDNALISHGYAPHMRDYDVTIDVLAPLPEQTGSYIAERVRYRFTHCVETHTRTAVSSEGWKEAWDDVFTDRDAWLAAGEPDGFLWGIKWSSAYPGLTYVDKSERAADWTERLGHEMHEVSIKTESFEIHLVFHDFVIDQLQDFTPDDPPTD